MMDLVTIEKATGIANLMYAIMLFIVGVLFYVLLPVGKIASDYSLLINSPSWISLNIISMVAIILGIFGLLGMYIKQIKESGMLMLSGLIMIMCALIMKASATSWEFIIWPAIMKNNPTSTLLTESLLYKDTGLLSFYGLFTLLFTVGYILFGIASLKTKIFPKWVSMFLIIGGPAYAILLSVPPFGIIGLILYSIAVFGFGLKLYNNSTGEN